MLNKFCILLLLAFLDDYLFQVFLVSLSYRVFIYQENSFELIEVTDMMTH